MRSFRLDLPAHSSAITTARAALDELAPSLSDEALIDLRLLVSEVVTNAIRHVETASDARIVLLVEPGSEGVRVEVHDEGPGFAPPTRPEPRAAGTSGWGLFLVQRLARRWGVEPAPGAHVWFVLSA
ncbi:MAG: ATP-binding protein [Solirubrobacterales bacterium]|nr:ATP-binding protein [Solirubrobacterales bacterium]